MIPGNCYAINRGKYAGKFIAYIGAIGNRLHFLMMPGDFQIVAILNSEFDFAQRDSTVNGIPPFVSFVEKLPDNVFEVIEAQYNMVKRANKEFIKNITSFRN